MTFNNVYNPLYNTRELVSSEYYGLTTSIPSTQLHSKRENWTLSSAHRCPSGCNNNYRTID